MKIQSLIRQGWKLVPVEIELTLQPGLPQVLLTGLPDQMIKESTLRLRAAFREQGFEFPANKQVLIHLRPSHLKKSSQGLDLALAVALLAETGQMPTPAPHFIFYGELSLKGEVSAPQDTGDWCPAGVLSHMVTGSTEQNFHFPNLKIKSIAELPLLLQEPPPPGEDLIDYFERPLIDPRLEFDEQTFRLITVIAAGEHSALFAGPAGSGKSTLARSIFPLLEDPALETFREARSLHHVFGKELKWRPFITPHHTTSHLAMTGGGSLALPGEISRAHGGLLLLDELLEFDPRVQEALREPFEEGCIHIIRNGHVEQYPARSVILATTNLCPCGRWVPKKTINCSMSHRRCRSYLEKLSGPVLDRFNILSFSHRWKQKGSWTLVDAQKKLAAARNFRRLERQQTPPNAQKEFDQCLRPEEFQQALHFIQSDRYSRRRLKSYCQVLRTLADLDISQEIKARHYDEAFELVILPFLELGSV